MRILTLGGVAGPLLFAVVVLLCAGMRPDYSHINQFISELGATGTPNAALMNYAGFIPTGLLLLAFGIAIGDVLPKHRLSTIGTRLITAFGAGVVVAGLMSCDPGCPQSGGTLENFIHDKISPLAFLCAIVGTGLLGIHFRRLPEWHRLWGYSVLTSVSALCFFAALVSTLETHVLTGLWQRLLIPSLFIWFAVVGLHAFRRSEPVPQAV